MTRGAFIAGLDRAARRAAKAWSVGETFEQELRADAAWERARARMMDRPSTSINPSRCGSCSEWNAAGRKRCRWCGASA